jgi:hypothetical protein
MSKPKTNAGEVKRHFKENYSLYQITANEDYQSTQF